MPFEAFAGRWAKAALPDEELLAFAEYLAQQAHLRAFLDVDAFRRELEEGLFFDSTIPIGYGLGSSGALCAAVYDRFAVAPVDRTATGQFPALKQQFSLMESHFHGNSSGTDPLICYLEHPILLQPKGEIALVDLPETGHAPFVFFLLDTGISRSTGPLVKAYLKSCEEAAYTARVEQVLKPAVDQLIDHFLTASWEEVHQGMQTVSRFQKQHFTAMIPEEVEPVWQQGLDSGDYFLKLCGAGGGGFLLGIARDESVLDQLNERFPILRIW